MSELGAAAAWYAQHGIPVLPCLPRDKRPLSAHGFKDATTDPTKVAAWWSEHPDANIGIPTGMASGLLVVDVDPRNGGPAGRSELIERFGPIPDTCEVITGGGGRHLFFRHPGGKVPKELCKGIDLKADGGYVIAPPSIHPSGRLYMVDGIEGAAAFLKVADPPGWLTERILAQYEDGDGASFHSGKIPASPEPIPAGRRNATLASMGGGMRRRGMTPESIAAALMAENVARCKPPLPEAEVRRIAASVGQYSPAEKQGRVNTDARPSMVWLQGTELETMTAINRPNLIESILPGEGAVLMAADAKTGKTVASLHMSLAVATGEDFLGRFPVQQGGAVYWMADDPNENRFVLNYQRLTRGRSLPNFIAAVDRRPLIPDGIVELEKAVRQVDARLVTIDCYSAIRARRRQGEDFVEAEYNELRILGEFAAKHHCVVNLLHHMSTVARGTGNLFNKIAGSFAMGAAPDGMLAIQTLSRTRTERLLLTQGRDLDCKPIVYARGEDGCLFLVAEGQLAESWDDAYKAFLGLGGVPTFTGKELGEALGTTDRAGRYRAAELKSAGAVFEITGQRRYRWVDSVLDILTRVRRINSGGRE